MSTFLDKNTRTPNHTVALYRATALIKSDTMTLVSPIRTGHPQSFLTLDSHLSPHIQTGHAGELYLIERLRLSGYIARKQQHIMFCGDVHCTCLISGEYFNIEVKTANCHGGKYQFCLKKPGKTDCSYSDYVALICIDATCNPFLYMVNSSLFNGVMQFTIPSHPTRYAGKFAPFLIRGDINFEDIRVTERLWVGL